MSGEPEGEGKDPPRKSTKKLPTKYESEDFTMEELPTPSPEEIGEIRERTARWVAKVLVSGFLILLGSPFAFLILTPKPTPEIAAAVVAQTIDLITTVSAVLSGLVGAVLLYYFGVERRNETK